MVLTAMSPRCLGHKDHGQHAKYKCLDQPNKNLKQVI